MLWGDDDVTDKEHLYFEDLAIGQTFKSEPFEVTSEAIKKFAGDFDPQPFHLDEATAIDTFFGGLAASGWHTAAMTMRLLVESVPLVGGVIGAGMDEIQWPKPVRPGDRLRTTTEIVDLRPSKSNARRGMGKFKTVTRNQNGETVQIVVANLVLQRRQGTNP
jgi:acyl dehydratase